MCTVWCHPCEHRNSISSTWIIMWEKWSSSVTTNETSLYLRWCCRGLTADARQASLSIYTTIWNTRIVWQIFNGQYQNTKNCHYNFIFSLHDLSNFIMLTFMKQQFSKNKHRIVGFCAIYFGCGNLSLTPFLSLTRWGCSWHNISQE